MSSRLAAVRAVSRRHLASSVRVALVATLVVMIVYSAAVAVLDLFVAHRLTAQVDRQLTNRLATARAQPPSAATDEPESAGGGGHYGLGIYGEPIYVWEVRPDGRLARTFAGTPPLPTGSWPAAGSGGLTRVVTGTELRLLSVPYHGGLLVAGESLTELVHVESVLRTSELVGAPVLLVTVFLASLLIGLRSAAPIELARRRQLEFTADASHELRTPLAVIDAELALARGGVGAGDPGRNGPASDSVHANRSLSTKSAHRISPAPEAPTVATAPEALALERIARESDRLKRIVDDLLWLARFDSAPPPPGSEPIDVATIAEVCAARFGSLATARSLDLRVERLGDEPATIVAPADWIDRLAGVLVDNACKYADEGGSVRIQVGRVGVRVVLAVEDSGPGIPAEERDRLFDRFRRATDRVAGHGLGLAIADSVVRSTGGRWRVGEADRGLGGARMEVSWPR
jgi:two-component system OmpR family sensor kinase